jgi:hypothetical protein
MPKKKSKSGRIEIPQIGENQPLKIEEELRPQITKIEIDKRDKKLFFWGKVFVGLIFVLSFLAIVFYFTVR